MKTRSGGSKTPPAFRPSTEAMPMAGRMTRRIMHRLASATMPTLAPGPLASELHNVEGRQVDRCGWQRACRSAGRMCAQLRAPVHQCKLLLQIVSVIMCASLHQRSQHAWSQLRRNEPRTACWHTIYTCTARHAHS